MMVSVQLIVAIVGAVVVVETVMPVVPWLRVGEFRIL